MPKDDGGDLDLLDRAATSMELIIVISVFQVAACTGADPSSGHPATVAAGYLVAAVRATRFML